MFVSFSSVGFALTLFWWVYFVICLFDLVLFVDLSFPGVVQYDDCCLVDFGFWVVLLLVWT